MTPPSKPKVGLFATCLVDLFRPSVGFASVKLLEQAGCIVDVPQAQTCCGQPAYNNGDDGDARELAKQTIHAFDAFDYVVVPSGSCGGMIKDYPKLFDDEPGWKRQAEDFVGKVYELVSFLTDVMGVDSVAARFPHKVTYHDSCSGLRHLGIKEQPRKLLGKVEGLELREMEDTDVCCGFGGTFCVKYPDISERMVNDKAERVRDTGAGTLLAGDLGCLMNIAGRISRRGENVKAYHVAEVLAGMADGPAIGEDKS